jgi:hypothetical protein
MQANLVYCHIGNTFPNYFYDSLYQTLNFNKDLRVYILTNSKFQDEIYSKINTLNIDLNTIDNIKVISIEQFSSSGVLKQFQNLNLHNSFRDNFWQHTTSRFIYIYEFMKSFDITNVFHIENDIMLYCNLQEIYNKIDKEKMLDKIIAVQDAPNRSICSIVFFPNEKETKKFLDFCINQLKLNKFLNDMNLMGMFKDKYTFPDSPDHFLAEKLGIFDGACIGQYLGGVDLRNIQLDQTKLKIYENPTIGFINETAEFKPDICSYTLDNKNKFCILYKEKSFPINCLHIHSKQLYNFSSCSVNFNNIITGDRILDLVDIIISTSQIFDFHSYSQNLTDKVLVVKDFNNINKENLNKYISEESKNKTIKLFCYTHLLYLFFEKIFPLIDKDTNIILYTHNSDHEVNDQILKYLDQPNLKLMYSQNLNIVHPKAKFLPIGIANSQWVHGNLDIFYTQCINSYYNKKTKNIYINISKDTYFYRKTVLENLDKNLKISSNKNYSEYLQELSEHQFCLCVRGNGIDTHRFWEALYLGVIPVIISNENTNCNLFVENLKKNGIPFHLVKNIYDIKQDTFTDDLYNYYFSKLKENFIILNLNHYRR